MASKPLPPRSLQPLFRTRWTSCLTTSHTFPALSLRGGHRSSPSSHGLPNFVHNQNPTLRRFLKCLTIRKDVLPVPHVVPYAIPSEARAASIVIPSGGRSPKPRDLQGTPDRFLRSLRSVEMTNGDGPDGAFTEHGLVSSLSPVAPKQLPPRSLQPLFRTRWTSRLTTSHTFQALSSAVVTKTVPPRTVYRTLPLTKTCRSGDSRNVWPSAKMPSLSRMSFPMPSQV